MKHFLAKRRGFVRLMNINKGRSYSVNNIDFHIGRFYKCIEQEGFRSTSKFMLNCPPSHPITIAIYI
jgi:hypothetical protein